ncbi:MAG: Lrp/AsnC family transcriptional regulator [Candidatus Thioglobus sp.]|jgi:Lrp/AsnC family transcriptional regulator|nr:Lrp/AsnC family transcriptional regulator [Candidatus Thioglobus sp.]|tara:strand:+ start:635 stop:1111 length:477 start_codon:yes stop_codon:yes gene_type:complete
MDAIDIKLLELLQHNAELTIQELSKEVHLSTTPCWKRINQLKSNGYINKTVSLVDRKRVGANVTAMVSIKVNNHNQERISIFAKTIQDIPEVIECYRMSGETDYLLKVVVSDIESYDTFYKNLIEKVQFLKVTSNFAIEEIKSTTEIPLTKLEQLSKK